MTPVDNFHNNIEADINTEKVFYLPPGSLNFKIYSLAFLGAMLLFMTFVLGSPNLLFIVAFFLFGWAYMLSQKSSKIIQLVVQKDKILFNRESKSMGRGAQLDNGIKLMYNNEFSIIDRSTLVELRVVDSFVNGRKLFLITTDMIAHAVLIVGNKEYFYEIVDYLNSEVFTKK